MCYSLFLSLSIAPGYDSYEIIMKQQSARVRLGAKLSLSLWAVCYLRLPVPPLPITFSSSLLFYPSLNGQLDGQFRLSWYLFSLFCPVILFLVPSAFTYFLPLSPPSHVHVLCLHPVYYFPYLSPQTLLFPSVLSCCNPLITLTGCSCSSMAYSLQLCSSVLLSSLCISSPCVCVCVCHDVFSRA